MRKFIGYLLIISVVPMLMAFIFLTYQEWTKAEGIHKVLDDKISVDTIHLEQTSYMTDQNGEIISEISLE